MRNSVICPGFASYARLLPYYDQQLHYYYYSICFKIKVIFGESSLKLRQTNWNVVRNNVNVVVDELPSQITIYTCFTIDIWIRRRRRTSMWFFCVRSIGVNRQWR